jgi:hypothetical protein
MKTKAGEADGADRGKTKERGIQRKAREKTTTSHAPQIK